jgi:hypothetical protein
MGKLCERDIGMRQIRKLFSRGKQSRERLPLGWFAITHLLVDDKEERRRLHGRWSKITCEGRTVYRSLRFAPNLKGTEKDYEIAIDWQAWLALSGYSEEVPDELELNIPPARWWHIPWIPFRHPDPMYRLASGLAIIAIVLGMLALLISVIPLLRSS